MEHITPNELSWENVKNEMNDFTIAESFLSRTILAPSPDLTVTP
jgi:hypothetical protein